MNGLPLRETETGTAPQAGGHVPPLEGLAGMPGDFSDPGVVHTGCPDGHVDQQHPASRQVSVALIESVQDGTDSPSPSSSNQVQSQNDKPAGLTYQQKQQILFKFCTSDRMRGTVGDSSVFPTCMGDYYVTDQGWSCRSSRGCVSRGCIGLAGGAEEATAARMTTSR